MKIRVLDRILVALAGLILITACVGVVAQVFAGVDVMGLVGKVLTKESTLVRVGIGVGAAMLLLLGVYCLMVLFRHRGRKGKFIVQRMESGELEISLDALRTMVDKCLEQHNEIQAQTVHLENDRDGVLIRIGGTIAGGISIPLTVDILQKQIKQYVTACSGVEVKGIKIQIETSGEDAKDAPFAIEPPVAMPLLKGNEPKEDPVVPPADEPEAMPEVPVTETQTVTEQDNAARQEAATAAAAMAAAESLMSEYAEDDDRPIHQRLFSTPEEPCIMPLPPTELTGEQKEEEKLEQKPEELKEEEKPEQKPEEPKEEEKPEQKQEELKEEKPEGQPEELKEDTAEEASNGEPGTEEAKEETVTTNTEKENRRGKPWIRKRGRR